MIGKRPEQVLIKGETQTVSCPVCHKSITVDSRTRQATCSCGQSINWGLKK
jgi:CDGSH-type Zn-finger protein